MEHTLPLREGILTEWITVRRNDWQDIYKKLSYGKKVRKVTLFVCFGCFEF